MAGNKISVGVEVDDGGAVRKINGISKSFDKLGGKGSGASLFGNVGAKAVAVGFNLIGDAISGTLGFLEDSVRAFIDDQASVALLDQALKNNIPNWDGVTTAVEAYTDAQINRGFSDDDTRASIGQLIGVTHDLNEAISLTTLAEDLARAKNIDLATATDIVTKAHEGNGKALKGLGIDVTGVTTAAGLLDAIQKNVEGSADKWATTTSGKLQIAQTQFSEATEKLGGVIMPALSTLMISFTDEWLPAFGKGWDKVTTAIKNVVAWINEMIRRFEAGIKKLKEFLNLQPLGSQPVKFGPWDIGGTPTPHAEGGWAGLRGPELAMLGERGPEYVRKAGTGTGDGGDGGGHGHDIIMDGKLVAQAVDERLFYNLRRVARAAKV